MKEKVMCPLMRKKCKKHKCVWYIPEICGVLEMDDSLGWLYSRAEDSGINVNVISTGDDEQ